VFDEVYVLFHFNKVKVKLSLPKPRRHIGG